MILCRSGPLETVARELERYRLDLMGVQEVTWNSGGKERAEDNFFFFGKGSESHQIHDFFCTLQKKITI
jgi:hypothetical protein